LNSIKKEFDIMPYKDKKKQAESARKHYLNNKDKMKKRAILSNKIRRNRNRDFIKDYKNTHPCVDCGESDFVVLQFDHIFGDKVKEIANMVRDCHSIKSLKKEILKCAVRCANCHLRRHYNLRESEI
jgi:hypothetical protein